MCSIDQPELDVRYVFKFSVSLVVISSQSKQEILVQTIKHTVNQNANNFWQDNWVFP